MLCQRKTINSWPIIKYTLSKSSTRGYERKSDEEDKIIIDILFDLETIYVDGSAMNVNGNAGTCDSRQAGIELGGGNRQYNLGL